MIRVLLLSMLVSFSGCKSTSSRNEATLKSDDAPACEDKETKIADLGEVEFIPKIRTIKSQRTFQDQTIIKHRCIGYHVPKEGAVSKESCDPINQKVVAKTKDYEFGQIDDEELRDESGKLRTPEEACEKDLAVNFAKLEKQKLKAICCSVSLKAGSKWKK